MKKSARRKQPLKRCILAGSSAALLAITSILGGSARAATQFWDNNGATAGVGFNGASNVWDVGTTSNWSPDADGATTSQTWTNGNDAIFQGTTGTVSITVGGVSALSVTLTTAYNLVGPGTLAISGGGTALISTVGATVGANVNLTAAGAPAGSSTWAVRAMAGSEFAVRRRIRI